MLAARFLALFVPAGGALTVICILAGVRPALACAVSASFLLLGWLAMAIAGRQAGARLKRGQAAIEGALTLLAAGRLDAQPEADLLEESEVLGAAVRAVQGYLKDRVTELQASQDQISAVLNSLAEGVIAVDDRQRILLLNHSAGELFRVPHDAVGRPLWEWIRNPQLQQWVSEVLERGEPAGGELELPAPAAPTLVVRVSRLTFAAARGAVVVAADVSLLKKLERVRQEFITNASHELKTPLAAIQACLESLLDGAIDDPVARPRFLRSAFEAAERLEHLVGDMLSLARIEAEGARQRLVAVDLGAVVETCCQRHRSAAERKQIALSSEPPAAPIYAAAEEESLEIILDNLIGNAVNYTNPGGKVIVRWREAGPVCELSVADTGIGIPAAHQARIFERFYRVDRARTRAVGGTGLGLAIVRHLVQSLRGEVGVTSRVGEGSTFTVRLARAEPGP
jgi:two-component system phosphate regulon sensor histidine kinase PhoR